MGRIYNFSAGPAVLPLEVLAEVQKELLDFQDTGMSILEMSHRSPAYEKVNAEAEADIKDLLGLGDDYCVLFLGGGGSLQFSMVPMNFLTPGKKGAYVITSTFSDKAMKEAQKIGEKVEKNEPLDPPIKVTPKKPRRYYRPSSKKIKKE